MIFNKDKKELVREPIKGSINFEIDTKKYSFYYVTFNNGYVFKVKEKELIYILSNAGMYIEKVIGVSKSGKSYNLVY